jgi:hypothetical protein
MTLLLTLLSTVCSWHTDFDIRLLRLRKLEMIPRQGILTPKQLIPLSVYQGVRVWSVLWFVFPMEAMKLINRSNHYSFIWTYSYMLCRKFVYFVWYSYKYIFSVINVFHGRGRHSTCNFNVHPYLDYNSKEEEKNPTSW